ncbi:MAG: hypothetical protein ACOH10_13755, partial [Rhodoglobus sp.]
MATSIARGLTTLYPIAVLGLETSQVSGNLVHYILNRSSPDVTFGAHGLRTGTFEILVGDLGDAEAMRQLHLAAGVFTLDEPEIGLTIAYVPSGEIKVNLDPEVGAWVVEVDFQEV